MERETLLLVVTGACFTVMLWVVALPLAFQGLRFHPSRRAAWLRLVVPLLAGMLMFAFLCGWAIQEPDPADESAGFTLCLLCALTAGVVFRTLVRSARALRHHAPGVPVPVYTAGLLKPRIVVSDEFRRIAPANVLAAALAHEHAHARRRDPLRIWLAQMATDLQWPIPGAARRFSAWLLALEAERDDEALANGANREDLAEAILTAARLQSRQAAGPCAGVTGAQQGIAWRVRRLFSEDAASRAANTSVFLVVLPSFLALTTAAVWLGIRFGDAALHLVSRAGP